MAEVQDTALAVRIAAVFRRLGDFQRLKGNDSGETADIAGKLADLFVISGNGNGIGNF